VERDPGGIKDNNTIIIIHNFIETQSRLRSPERVIALSDHYSKVLLQPVTNNSQSHMEIST